MSPGHQANNDPLPIILPRLFSLQPLQNEAYTSYAPFEAARGATGQTVSIEFRKLKDDDYGDHCSMACSLIQLASYLVDFQTRVHRLSCKVQSSGSFKALVHDEENHQLIVGGR